VKSYLFSTLRFGLTQAFGKFKTSGLTEAAIVIA